MKTPPNVCDASSEVGKNHDSKPPDSPVSFPKHHGRACAEPGFDPLQTLAGSHTFGLYWLSAHGTTRTETQFPTGMNHCEALHD